MHLLSIQMYNVIAGIWMYGRVFLLNLYSIYKTYIYIYNILYTDIMKRLCSLIKPI